MMTREGNGTSVPGKQRTSIYSWFVGDAAHGDFVDAIESLRRNTRLSIFSDAHEVPSDETLDGVAPELILVAESRPGAIRVRDVELLRRRFPLAGVVSLLGSWCEGQSRTGRPIPGAERLYWHEFELWLQRQLRLRAAGRCPDWAWPIPPDSNARALMPTADNEPRTSRGLIVIRTPRWETADALADVLQDAHLPSVWQPPGRPAPQVRGVFAGIWEGGQLDDGEAGDLADFCRRLSHEAAPVVALLDFPRRDRAERARQLGAAQVLGKPWVNSELIQTLEAFHALSSRARGNAITAA